MTFVIRACLRTSPRAIEDAGLSTDFPLLSAAAEAGRERDRDTPEPIRNAAVVGQKGRKLGNLTRDDLGDASQPDRKCTDIPVHLRATRL